MEGAGDNERRPIWAAYNALTWTFMGGDDGTRTHDPLLANNRVESPRASTGVLTRQFGRSRTPTVCPGGYCGGYCDPASV
jgi:hypothetical protein